MELKEIYRQGRRIGNHSKLPISFEVFPPKDGNLSELFEQVRILSKYNPALVSLTYGANGSNRDLSYELLQMFIHLGLNVMPHFTCVCSSHNMVQGYIREIENLGIENILALRGDLPDGQCLLDFEHASDLVDFIHQKSSLSIGVAGYPECHVECESLDKDIKNLKQKIDAGADAIFTQLFFNNDKFYRYVEKVRNAGIDVPIVAGIMPIRGLKQIEKMVAIAGVEIPKKLKSQLEEFPQNIKKIGVEFAINQCQDLMDNGVEGLHFFTLNHADQTSEILDNIL